LDTAPPSSPFFAPRRFVCLGPDLCLLDGEGAAVGGGVWRRARRTRHDDPRGHLHSNSVPSTGDACLTHFADRLRTDRCDSLKGSWEATVTRSDWPTEVSLQAAGDSALGRASRRAIPHYPEFKSSNTELRPGKPMHWDMVLRAIPADVANNGKTSLKSRMDAGNPGGDYLH
jgi:hypothetical protein